MIAQDVDQNGRIHTLIPVDDEVPELNHCPIPFCGRDDPHRFKALECVESGRGGLPPLHGNDALSNVDNNLHADLKRALNAVLQEVVSIEPVNCHLPKSPQP